jgi:hypothetical protein
VKAKTHIVLSALLVIGLQAGIWADASAAKPVQRSASCKASAAKASVRASRRGSRRGCTGSKPAPVMVESAPAAAVSSAAPPNPPPPPPQPPPPPPNNNCPLSTPGSTIGMTMSDCTLVASDTAHNPDPRGFWGTIDCQDPTRQSQQTSGGDPHPSGAGPAQGDTAYRRMTAFDGDNFYGERCELGYNSVEGPTVLYHDGQRRVTFLSVRLPNGTNPDDQLWRTVAQMKQTNPCYCPQPGPEIELETMYGQWQLYSNWQRLWDAPAQQNVWTRFAFDITYSPDPAIGSIKVYVDLNGDGDFGDSSEQSPVIHAGTLRREEAGGPSAYAPGQAIPDHLRAGIYQDPNYSCPSGCSVDIDNVQVFGP